MTAHFLKRKYFKFFYKIFVILFLPIFVVGLVPVPLFAQTSGPITALNVNLPPPGVLLQSSSPFVPAYLKGMVIHPENPFRFDFIVDSGHSGLKGEGLKPESTKLIKYFLASLTIPEDDLWVNLSPYEKDRIVPDEFGVTEMGRDLLAQDYILKQLTASLMYPENGLGKKFWNRVYEKAQELYGTTEIPVNTFNKVWIVPEKAVVYEQGKTVIILQSHLKVMLEEDYLALSKNLDNESLGINHLAEGNAEKVNNVSSLIIRDVIIPEIEKEVNEGKNFGLLRQIYHSMILAAWYKKNLRNSLLNQAYADQKKILGVDVEDKEVKDKIYQQYLEAFSKGVYNYIKEDYDPQTQQIIPRQYFSGGLAMRVGQKLETRNGRTYTPTASEQRAVASTGYEIHGTEILPETVDSASEIAHVSVRELEVFRRLLRKIAFREEALGPGASDVETMEFIVRQLIDLGFAEEINVTGKRKITFIKIKDNLTETNPLAKAIKEKLINVEGGVPAINFVSTAQGQWQGAGLVVLFDNESQNFDILDHEIGELELVMEGMSWVEAHNEVVRMTGVGDLIGDRERDQYQAGREGGLGAGIGDFFRRRRSMGAVEDITEASAVTERDGIASRGEPPLPVTASVAVTAEETNGKKIVETDMTLNYGGLEKWGVERILIDFVQNHKPGDTRGSKIEVNFHLKSGKVIPLNKLADNVVANDVDFIEIADDGIGYDYEHLRYFLTTKGSAEEGGKFGEGLKIATAAALKMRMTVEFRSRRWSARPFVVPKVLNQGHANEIRTSNVSFEVTDASKIKGSRTIIRNPSETVFGMARGLSDLVITLRGNYQPISRVNGVGEIVDLAQNTGGAIYVKGNLVLRLPNRNAGVYDKTLFNYNLFDDSGINRDRDMVPADVVSRTLPRILVEGVTPEIARIFLQHSLQEKKEDGKYERKRNFQECSFSSYAYDSAKTASETLAVWRKSFYEMFGQDALLGEVDHHGNPEGTTQQALTEGKNVVFLSGFVVSILLASGVETAKSFYHEKENRVSTGITLNYREKAWDFNRILLDAVQNHLRTDSGATEVRVEFSVSGRESEWIDISEISGFQNEQIASVRIRDNGHGYDYNLLGILHSTKTEITSAGGWGEGLKMLSAAVLRHGLGIELRSWSWRAEAVTGQSSYESPDGKWVSVQKLDYAMLHLRSKKIEGSQTIFTKLIPGFLEAVRQLPQKVIALQAGYTPVSRVEGVGEISSISVSQIFVSGLEVKDVVTDQGNILGYNFTHVEGIVPSPDRNVLHTNKVRDSIAEMLARTDSIEALEVVIARAIGLPEFHPEFQDVTQRASYANQDTWRLAWDRVVLTNGWNPKRIVLGTHKTIEDPDAAILLRNMGYSVVRMNSDIAQVIHKLGVRLDYEILEHEFEYMSLDDLTEAERGVLSMREVIDRHLAEMVGRDFDPRPIDIWVAVRSKITGEELEGLQGMAHFKTGRISIGRRNLKTPLDFATVYIEEIGHQLSRAGDYTREFTDFFMALVLSRIFTAERLGNVPIKAPGLEQGSATVNGPSSSIQKVDGDPAAVGKNRISSENPGGIDLRSLWLNFESFGEGIDEIEVPFIPADLESLEDTRIQGFSPFIFQITPLPTLNPLLGVNSKDSEQIEDLSFSKF